MPSSHSASGLRGARSRTSSHSAAAAATSPLSRLVVGLLQLALCGCGHEAAYDARRPLLYTRLRGALLQYSAHRAAVNASTRSRAFHEHAARASSRLEWNSA